MRTTTGWLMLASTLSCLVLSSSGQTTTKSIDQKCLAVKTCSKGGVPANACTIANERCPPCITFYDNGCYEINGDKCPFGDDCSAYFPLNGGTITNRPTTIVNTTDAPSSTTTTPATVTPAPTNESTNAVKSTGGGQMSVVLGIIGAAIGVIAVGIIFMVLIRRSRTEEDEEELATPIGKRSHRTSVPTTSVSGTYVSYGPPPPPSTSNYPTTPTQQVHQYYNDHAQPSPRQGGGGGGGRGPSQQPVAKPVRPVAAVNAPTFFKATPVTTRSSLTHKGPVPDLQLNDLHAEASSSSEQSGIKPSEETESSHLHRRVSSPRPRHDSYEF